MASPTANVAAISCLPAPTSSSAAAGVSGHGHGASARGLAIETSESNHTIATAHTDLLLTPSTSSHNQGQLAFTSSGSGGGGDPRRVGVTLPEEAEEEEEEEGVAVLAAQHHHHHQHQQHLGVNAPGSGRPSSPGKRKSSVLVRLVAQEPSEPLFVILFKWLLIVAGMSMLGIVIIIMGEVIYSWATGDLQELNSSRSIIWPFWKSSDDDANVTAVATNDDLPTLNTTEAKMMNATDTL